MIRRHARRLRGPVSLFALLLLLRAAMPFLASASADLQGLALSEVCSVHGVSLGSQVPERRDPLPGAAADPAGSHCALGALGAIGATSAPPGVSVSAPTAVGAAVLTAWSVPRPDAAATWVARNKHGPPTPA